MVVYLRVALSALSISAATEFPAKSYQPINL